MELGEIYYFTAPVKERFPNDDAPRRQHTYLRVLENQGIQVVRGQIRKDKSWMRLISTQRPNVIQPEIPSHFGLTQLALDVSVRAAAPDTPRANVYKLSEKGSDVNLASFLLRDAYQGNLSAALVVTGDSDLVTPVRFAVEAGLDVKVVIPNRFQKVTQLKTVATQFQELHPATLDEHQLPNAFITSKGGNIVRPKTWR
jgi:uncharacterized LabA/DUF88 family protein